MEPYHYEFDVEEYETECDGQCRGIDDPDCDGCDGKYMTTWNPMCKLDWYAIWNSQQVLLNASKYPYKWTDQEDDEDIPEKYDYKKAVAPLETQFSALGCSVGEPCPGINHTLDQNARKTINQSDKTFGNHYN